MFLYINTHTAQSEGDLRLVGSTACNIGRLEIFLNGEWGTVCRNRFEQREALIACSQLAFSSASRHGTVVDFG